MGKRWQLLMGLGAGVLVAGTAVTALIGCSGSPASTSTSRPSAAQLNEGVNLLDAKNPSWGFNAAFVKAGHVVYVESRMGGAKPEVYQKDSPDEPMNEMDLRFVDAQNRTFYAQRGGDGWIDPSWGAEISKSIDPSVTQADREADWALAHEAAAALPTALGDAFKDHNYHLTAFTSYPSPANDPTTKQLQSERGYGAYYNGGGVTYSYGKYSKAVGCAAWVCGGSHSAVAMYASGGLVINACNHGSCAGGSGMRYDCAHTGATVAGATINGETNGGSTGWWDGSGGCQTAYSWNSGNGSHLCNDDAVYEMYSVDVGGQQDSINFTYATGGSCRGSLCGSGSPAHYACNCGNGCSGDWNTPYCF
jgi:hypothetical protein